MSVVVLTLLACATPPAEPSPDQIRDEVRANPDPAQRLTLLEVHAAREPASPEAHLWLARAYRNANDPRWQDEYQKVIDLDPKDALAHVELAWGRLEPTLRRGADPTRDDLAAAEGLVKQAVANQPTCAIRHELVGIYALEAEQDAAPADAAPFLEQAIAACAGDAAVPAWEATLGRVARPSDPAAARKWLCKAVQDGDVEAAEDCLALSHPEDGWEPGDDVFGQELVGWRLAAHDPEAAIARFEKATSLAPKDALAWETLGGLYERTKDSPRACHAYAEAIQLRQDAPAPAPAEAADAGPTSSSPEGGAAAAVSPLTRVKRKAIEAGCGKPAPAPAPAPAPGSTAP